MIPLLGTRALEARSTEQLVSLLDTKMEKLPTLGESAEHWNNLRGPQAVCEDLVRFIALLGIAF